MNTHKYYSDKDLADSYDVSRQTIWRWVRLGLLDPPVKLGPNTSRWTGAHKEKFEAARATESKG
jgi:predicted DNA-binding transcriptional regulator AlpA